MGGVFSLSASAAAARAAGIGGDRQERLGKRLVQCPGGPMTVQLNSESVKIPTGQVCPWPPTRFDVRGIPHKASAQGTERTRHGTTVREKTCRRVVAHSSYLASPT